MKAGQGNGCEHLLTDWVYIVDEAVIAIEVHKTRFCRYCHHYESVIVDWTDLPKLSKLLVLR